MAQKSSFFLAVLIIANPFMLLFFQNCSVGPHAQNSVPNYQINYPKSPASVPDERSEFVKYKADPQPF